MTIGSFEELIALAPDKRDITMKMALERDVRLVRCEDGQLEIAVEAERAEDPGARPATQAHRLDRQALDRRGVQGAGRADACGRRWTPRQAELESDVQSDPLVQAVLNRFPGAKVVGVTQNAPEAGAPDAAPSDENED